MWLVCWSLHRGLAGLLSSLAPSTDLTHSPHLSSVISFSPWSLTVVASEPPPPIHPLSLLRTWPCPSSRLCRHPVFKTVQDSRLCTADSDPSGHQNPSGALFHWPPLDHLCVERCPLIALSRNLTGLGIPDCQWTLGASVILLGVITLLRAKGCVLGLLLSFPV